MPLQLPNLDDRSYADLVNEARALIPSYAPSWTDHNPSDPGITLIELFAYLTEMLIYRLNRVTDANKLAFLKLLRGPEWAPEKILNEAIRDAVLEFREENRAITGGDFERLALAADPEVARARCLSRRNLESENPLASGVDRPGHVSVVIVPVREGSEGNPQPSPELIQNVRNDLEPRRLLTTQLHVVGPRYVTVGVRITVVLKPDALEGTVRNRVLEALRRFLDPLIGGSDGKGWVFGRDVYVSEIYQLLDTQPGVDYVTRTVDPATDQPVDELAVDAGETTRLRRSPPEDPSGEIVAVELKPDELVDARVDPNDITIATPQKA